MTPEKTSLRGSSHCTADDLLFTFVYFRETKNIAQMVSFAASKWIMKQIKRKVSKLKIKIGNLKLCFDRIAF